MKNTFKKLLNIISQKLQSSKSRSYGYGWTKLRKQHIMEHPRCAICGYLSFSNDVHHIEPRHVNPDRLLDPDNLITLCRKYSCHLRFGHFGDYRRYWNPNIKDFAVTGEKMSKIETSFKCRESEEKN